MRIQNFTDHVTHPYEFISMKDIDISELLQVMFHNTFPSSTTLHYSAEFIKKKFTIIFTQLPDPWPQNPGIGSHLLQINVTFT